MIKINSISFKFLALIVVAFLVTTISIALLANRQLTSIADHSQAVLYSEKLHVIIDTFDRQYRLQDTAQDETVTIILRNMVLEDLRDTYYTNMDIYPFIIDSKGTVVMHPQLERGDTSTASLDFVQKATRQKEGDLNYEYQRCGEMDGFQIL